MTSRALTRVLELFAVLLIVAIGTFALADLAPGDIAVEILGPDRPAEEYQELRAELGLDQPTVDRFRTWIGDAVRGDLGSSAIPPHVGVTTKVSKALPVSLQLTVISILLSLAVAVPLAMVCAHRPGGRLDRIVNGSAFAMLSIPNFIAGLLLILIFVKTMGWLPRSEWIRPSNGGWVKNLRHSALPTLTICLGQIPIFLRTLRSDLVATMAEDFVLSARSRGTPPLRLLVTEALRPSLFSLITVLGVVIGTTMGSAVVVEQLFGLPGLGSEIVSAARRGDVTVLQGGVLVIAIIYVVVNAAVDLLYSITDPRVRHASR